MTYVNALGGQSLYCKNEFKTGHIDLFFLEMGDVEFYNNYSSILDILFLHDRENIKRQIKKYSLI